MVHWVLELVGGLRYPGTVSGYAPNNLWYHKLVINLNVHLFRKMAVADLRIGVSAKMIGPSSWEMTPGWAGSTVMLASQNCLQSKLVCGSELQNISNSFNFKVLLKV
jgi:hypothetical protein